jgi:DNA-binding SARP family transcriptional activator
VLVTSVSIEFRLLGPLEARVDGTPVALGGPKQRALMALLVLHANDVVPLDVLIEELWDGPPPPSAPAYVQNCVSRLRKLIRTDALETRPPGYRLRVDPDAIDARRFERLVREARALPSRERAAALREALGLWSGSPLSDLAFWSFAQDPIRRLEEERVNALQMRLEAELELGLHREAIGELDTLVREHPTHERLRWLQMLALHRSDRRLDALAAYQAVRLAIVEESGMEPGEELRALHRRILQDDPTLMPGGVAEEIAERPAQLARKVVAVCIVELLVDDELDVEAARGVVSRGLASLEEIVLRHGGAVEQLLGEEAVAVFGLPAAHEDDVLRALRSATELQDALGSLPMRAAVETGDVLVGEDGRVLSGGALTTARRVKEGAGEGEILLGPTAASRSAGAAWTEPSEGGHRLVELVEGAPPIARRPDAPLVGRRAELERLVVAVRESASASACRRVVVLGEPGIGKTRLAAELVTTLDNEALVLTGRCVPYAEGATYLALAEVVGQIVQGEDLEPAIQALLAEEPEGELAASRLADALSGAGAVDSGDVFWATRKLLETIAREQPVLVVLEDVHWAEPTFLDLIEYLVGWSIGAPIALVCLARTELLDARPGWAADTLALRPLADDETAELLDALPEALALDADARAAVVAVAEGNPLFLEQLAAHALDGPVMEGKVPASLESLLASRLDSLEPGERGVLQRAAIIGREFTRAAVDALAPDGARGSATSLLALVRRRLVRPDAARSADDAFLFDHALIRDATYAAIAKAERARLHEQLARWLDQRDELDEIVGHHLEQAALCLEQTGAEAAAVAQEAVDRLARAGERAVWSREHRTAVRLLMRAAALLGDTDIRRLELECLASVPLRNLWETSEAFALLEDVERRAVETGDRRLALRAGVEQMLPRLESGLDLGTGIALLNDAAGICEAEGDLVGLARAFHLRSLVENRAGRLGAAAEAARRAGECYLRVGAGRFFDQLSIECMADGEAPIAAVVAICEERLQAMDAPRHTEGLLLDTLAVVRALSGQLDEARALLERARARLLEVGDDVAVTTQWAWYATYVEVLALDARRAEDVGRPALAAAQAHGDRAYQSHFEGLLAETALLEGDHETALSLAEAAREHARANDLFHALGWRLPRARALVGVGELDEAERLAREAVTIVDPTEHLLGRGQARVAHAEVLAAMGRFDAAATEAEEGVKLLTAKGATLLVERALAQVAALRGGEPANRAPLETA